MGAVEEERRWEGEDKDQINEILRLRTEVREQDARLYALIHEMREWKGTKTPCLNGGSGAVRVGAGMRQWVGLGGWARACVRCEWVCDDGAE